MRIAALVWFPDGDAETVILALHGSGGCRGCWGGVGVPGYSFAARELARGRALVAIHLPGFGDSRAVAGATGMEDHASVVDQVADALRAGSFDVEGAAPRAFAKVVGVGISIGGLLVGVAQGLFGSFDALVPMSYSHGGFSREYVACVMDGRCPEDPREVNWHLPQADPAVMEAAANLSAPRDCGQECAAVFANFLAWSGCFECGHEALRPLEAAPAPDDVSSRVTVPVLVVVGTEDFYYDPSAVAREGEHFPAAEFTLLRPEATGHFVLFHRNADAVQGAVGAWLDARGFGRSARGAPT